MFSQQEKIELMLLEQAIRGIFARLAELTGNPAYLSLAMRREHGHYAEDDVLFVCATGISRELPEELQMGGLYLMTTGAAA